MVDPQSHGWRGSGAILAVEDDALTRALLRRALERYGFEVLEAADGQEALDVFGARSAEIRAVLLDLTMPRMSGGDSLEALKRIRNDVPVIVMSGHSASDVTDLLRRGLI